LPELRRKHITGIKMAIDALKGKAMGVLIEGMVKI